MVYGKRGRKVYGWTVAEYASLVRIFCSDSSEYEVFDAILKMAKSNLSWGDTEFYTGVSKRRILRFLLQKITSREVDFDESVRWLPTERALKNPGVTFLIDHTNVKLKWKQSNGPKARLYFNLKKGMSYKYFVACTVQQTPISTSTAQPGRRHDFFHFVSPLRRHFINDFGLADGGYRGIGPHIRVPIRKPNKRKFTDEQNVANFKHSRVRSRIERCFGIVKRFKILRVTDLSPRVHELFFRLILVCEHKIRVARNVQCRTPYPSAEGPLDPGRECHCDWQKL